MSHESISSRIFFYPNSVERPSLTTRILRRTYSYGSNSSRHGSFGSHDSAMQAIWLIIGLNTAVFGIWTYCKATSNRRLAQQLHEHATLSWDNIRAGRYYTLLTSAFSHENPFHCLFNMIAFHTFGSIMSFVPGVGALHVVSLCLGSAIAGSFFWLYNVRSSSLTPPDRRFGPIAQGGVQTRRAALGASGMVMGAAGAATCLMPFAPIYMMIPIAIPLWVGTSIYAAIDTYYIGAEDGVGHAAHLGGAFFGAVYYFAYLRGLGGVWWMLRSRLRR